MRVCLQGGGLSVFGTATLINSNIYFNTATTGVSCSHLCSDPLPHWIQTPLITYTFASLLINPTGYPLHRMTRAHEPLTGRAAKLKVARFISRCEMCRLPRPSLRVHLALWFFWERPLPSTARSAGGSRHRR